MAMLRMCDIRRKGATVHGFRSTFRDWAAETETASFRISFCEIALAHAVSDKNAARRRRGDMDEKRKRLAADWAAYCERAPASGANVHRIREIA